MALGTPTAAAAAAKAAAAATPRLGEPLLEGGKGVGGGESRSSEELTRRGVARQVSWTKQLSPRQYALHKFFASVVAGLVCFLLATIMGIAFGLLVFGPIPGGVAKGVHMTLIGVNMLGNGWLALTARLPCVVVTADNGVVAPVVADLVIQLAKDIDDPQALLATAVAGVSVACTVFGLVQLLVLRLRLVRLVQYLPYSIPMGFLSGIGLELCSGVSLAGSPAAQLCAVIFATALCLGSWWRGWPLATLFPALLITSISAFYACGSPDTWMLQVEETAGSEAASFAAGLWSPAMLREVRWGVLATHGLGRLAVLCLLGCLQNCLFAGLFAHAPSLEDPVDANQVLFEFSQAFTVGGVFGFTGGFHNMACFSLSRELKSHKRVPGALTAILSSVLLLTGLGPVLKVPRFVFAGLLFWVGLKFLRTYLLQPARMLPRAETANIVAVAAVMKLGGFSSGVLVGLALALINIVRELGTLSCVQYISTGRETRSNAVRSLRAEQLLLQHGHNVLVLRLAPGFVFFATSAQLLHLVEEKLHLVAPPWQSQDPLGLPDDSESDDPDADALSESGICGLCNVVIDFTLCRGFDGSLVGVLQQLGGLGSQNGFLLRLSGLQEVQLQWLKAHDTHHVYSFFPDLDRALEAVEDELLAKLGRSVAKEKTVKSIVSAGHARRLSTDGVAWAALSDGDGRDGLSWVLLLLYSDSSATSRSARPAIAKAMALLEGRCAFYEAPEEQCPELSSTFGPGPALVLIDRARMCRVQWKLCGAALSSSVQSPEQIAREVEQQINEADNVFRLHGGREGAKSAADVEWDILKAMGSPVAVPPSPATGPPSPGLAGGLSPRPDAGQLGSEADPGRRVRRTSSIRRIRSQEARGSWERFLDLAGLPDGGPLVGLATHVKGPRRIERGEVLLYKGAAPSAVFFVIDGMVSLWNEGHGHDQDAMGPPLPCAARDILSPKGGLAGRRMSSTTVQHQTMLSKGTSRLLRIGPGWVLGGLPPLGVAREAGWRPQLVPLTHVAETALSVFELGNEAAQQLEREDPALMLALMELLAHFSGVFQQHMLAQLSDWHVLAYGR